MSSGIFVTAGYRSDLGIVHPIRVQPETITDDNDELLPIAANATRFRRGGSRRKTGQFARFITLSSVVGDASAAGPYANSRVYAKVTIFSKAVFDALIEDSIFAYAGKNFTIVSKTGERRV